MKKVNLLSKAEMKRILGGVEDNDEDEDEDDGLGDSAKQKACKNKKVNDYCEWKYQGVKQTGWCQSYMAQPLHCSDLP